MNPSLSRNPALGVPDLAPERTGMRLRLDPERLSAYRSAALGYAKVLAGTGGRLVLQVVYFFVLANTLSLSDMGVFASVSAAGVLIGCMAGFGFQSFVFRAAAGRRSAMGGYLAAFYAGFVVALPLMFVIAGLLYLLLFREMIALPAYLAIILVEVALWRLIELIVQMNNGLGRFGAAASVVSLSAGFRAAAAVAFWAQGGGDAETWAVWYLIGNGTSLAILALLFHPRIRLRWRPSLIRLRLRDGSLFAFSYFAFLASNEVDKIVVLALAGERMAGIYAIAMRIIDLTAVPLRPVFVLYSRKLIQAGRATRALVHECLKVEAAVALVSTAGLLAVVALLTLWPDLLGANVATASAMLAAIVIVPAVRNLLEFHSELFFAFDHMILRAFVIAGLVIGKAVGLAILLSLVTSDWAIWLNALYGATYVISFAAIYGLLARRTAS